MNPAHLQDYLDYANNQPAPEQKRLQAALKLAQTHYPDDAVTTSAHEPLLQHLLQVALMVRDMDLLAEAVAATLLTDIPTYCADWKTQVSEQCGQAVATLVAGIDEVQKLTHFAKVDALATPEERANQAETMRKMLLAMVSDIRVVLIKLALRTRSMQYLSQTPDSPQNAPLPKKRWIFLRRLPTVWAYGNSNGSLKTWVFATTTPKNTNASPNCWTKNAPSVWNTSNNF